MPIIQLNAFNKFDASARRRFEWVCAYFGASMKNDLNPTNVYKCIMRTMYGAGDHIAKQHMQRNILQLSGNECK